MLQMDGGANIPTKNDYLKGTEENNVSFATRSIWCGGRGSLGNKFSGSQNGLDFDPNARVLLMHLVWTKFPKLSQQYWDYEILMAMGKTLGARILKKVRIDEETKKKQIEETTVATNKEGPTKKKRKRSKKNKNKGDKVGESAIVDLAFRKFETLVEETSSVVEANIAVEVGPTPPNDEHLNAVALMPLSLL
ncbi:hypothetical protein IFM89_019006 [Coptis chinensis]|uniref:Uncharacterized protein n=1 Tax=Coptis chinensis TaxID=261450 RepID=A0A835I641_9MAGN|nr:hypothetical protein IFM89_019006 [Coptis chinensis]